MSAGQPDLRVIFAPVESSLREVEEVIRRSAHVEDFPLLGEVLDYVLDWPGKHLRPVVTLLASQLHPHPVGHEVPMAAAVEMLHIATLVHDDTVDAAELRRGRATVSNLWGKDVAVLVGDYLFAKSATVACEAGDLKAVRLFAQAVMALSAGELRELVTSHAWDQTRERYWKRIEEKTASLFASAAEVGAVLSGGPESQGAALRAYGYNLGMAFQVVDDILDFTGTEESVGKPVGNDLAQGVLTLPVILLAERDPYNQVLHEAFGAKGDVEKLRKAVELVRDSRTIEEAFCFAEDFCEKARRALDGVPASPARDSLLSLTRYVTARDR
jgi:heptaprenyl diphosphate synthase/octaprenyl-diphosphate synthase